MARREPLTRSQMMARILSKDTKPELKVRRIVHQLGYRYRLHVRELPGKPDIVLRRLHKVIQVHGCFWHSHPSDECRDSRRPKTNTGYWTPKLDANRLRDERNLRELITSGWSCLVVWDCETDDLDWLRGLIQAFLEDSWQHGRSQGLIPGEREEPHAYSVCQ